MLLVDPTPDDADLPAPDPAPNRASNRIKACKFGLLGTGSAPAETPARPAPAQPVTAGSARLLVRPGGAPVRVEPRQVAAREEPGAQRPSGILRLERADGKAHVSRSGEVSSDARPPQFLPDSEEDQWAAAPPLVNWRWAGGIATALIAIVLGSLAAVQVLVHQRRTAGFAAVPAADLEVERIEVDDRAGFLTRSPAELLDEACAVLERHCAARTADEALAAARTPQRNSAHARQHWQPWPSPPLLERRDLIQCSLLGDCDPPFVVVTGACTDFRPFRAYFVSENGRLRLDWEATTGFSAVPIPRLPATTTTEPVLVRCLLEPRAFHTAALPEERFRCFLLEDPVTYAFVWGYTERGGAPDQAISAVLGTDSQFVEQRSAERVTLELVAAPDRDTPAQFMITEMLHIEWVMP